MVDVKMVQRIKQQIQNAQRLVAEAQMLLAVKGEGYGLG